jgi:hypothetical protein
MLYRGAAVNERLPIGTAGQVLKVNSGATAPEWGNAPDSIDDYTVVTTSQTLVNGARIAANTTSGPFTLTLPATPSDGDTVYLLDFASTFDTNNLTLGRNGSNIEGLAEDMICNVEGSSFKMVYTGVSSGWQMIPYYGTGVAIGSNATDVLSLSSGQIVADDPAADRIVFWDDSESKLTYLQAGSGLTISGTTITASGGDIVSIAPSAADILTATSGAISADDAGSDKIVFWDDSENKLAYGSVSDVGAAAASHTHPSTAISDSTTAGRALLTGVDASAQRTSLGLGTAAVEAATAFAASSHTHAAADVTTGTFDNARINFAAPAAIGGTTAAAGTFTTLAANNGTLTASAPVLDLAQTWNAAGVSFVGLRFDVTNTASATGSRVLHFTVGGTSNLLGIYRDAAGFPASPRFEIGSSGVAWNIRTRTGGGVGCNFSDIVGLGSSLQFGVGSGTSAGDLILQRDAANIFAQVNGANAQEFRIYNTFTSATNHERGFLKWSSNVFQIGTEKGSAGGTARALALQTDGTTRMTVGTDGFVGIGVTAERPIHIQGTSAVGRIDRVGIFGPAWMMTRIDGSILQSSWIFGPATGFASVTNDDFAIIDYGTATTGTGGTARLTISKTNGQLTVNGNLNLSTKDLVTDTTTGTKIGTATTQKLGFFNATPAVQPAAVADATDAASTQARLNDLLARLRTLGLIAT